MLYSTFKGNSATCYGSEMEDKTREQYQTHQQRSSHPDTTVEDCGLFVSQHHPWLAATPDGLVNNPSDNSQHLGLIEIKNPYSARQKTLLEACTGPGFCLKKAENIYKLNRRHDYYYQIQCQLYCVDRDWCDFVLRTDKDIHIESIYRDKAWWDEQLPALEKFYFNALLPELASPRHRKGGIREPAPKPAS